MWRFLRSYNIMVKASNVLSSINSTSIFLVVQQFLNFENPSRIKDFLGYFAASNQESCMQCKMAGTTMMPTPPSRHRSNHFIHPYTSYIRTNTSGTEVYG